MVKFCINKYPKGSLPHQHTDGRYIDGYLYSNIKILAENIIKDMTYLGIFFSSTYEVGAGKSTLAQQVGECYTEMINELHGFNIPFTEQNIVFRPEDLIETAFKVPQYSCIVLDEWSDYHYWSELGTTLREFFRKCRQLNLFIIIIIPNFFQLPIGYSISRSIFAIDVKFLDNFDRGLFDFYNFDKKRELYMKGKKFYNYNVGSPNFHGGFNDGYSVGKENYLKKKRADLQRYDDMSEKKTPSVKDIKVELFSKVYKDLGDISLKRLSHAFGVSERTTNRWIKDYKQQNSRNIPHNNDTPT